MWPGSNMWCDVLWASDMLCFIQKLSSFCAGETTRGERGSLRLGYLETSEFLGKLNGFPTSSLVLKAGNKLSLAIWSRQEQEIRWVEDTWISYFWILYWIWLAHILPSPIPEANPFQAYFLIWARKHASCNIACILFPNACIQIGQNVFFCKMESCGFIETNEIRVAWDMSQSTPSQMILYLTVSIYPVRVDWDLVSNNPLDCLNSDLVWVVWDNPISYYKHNALTITFSLQAIQWFTKTFIRWCVTF